MGFDSKRDLFERRFSTVIAACVDLAFVRTQLAYMMPQSGAAHHT